MRKILKTKVHELHIKSFLSWSLLESSESYLFDIFLLFLFESQLNEDLLQFFIAIVDDELFKTIALQQR